MTVGRVRKATRGRHRRDLSGGVLGPDREHVVRVGGQPGERRRGRGRRRHHRGRAVLEPEDVVPRDALVVGRGRPRQRRARLGDARRDRRAGCGGRLVDRVPPVVVTVIDGDVALSWAPLCAMTTNMYAVLARRPVTVADVVVDVATIWSESPATRTTSYRAIPLSASVDGDQVSVTDVSPIALAVGVPGVLGRVVSTVGVAARVLGRPARQPGQRGVPVDRDLVDRVRLDVVDEALLRRAAREPAPRRSGPAARCSGRRRASRAARSAGTRSPGAPRTGGARSGPPSRRTRRCRTG